MATRCSATTFEEMRDARSGPKEEHPPLLVEAAPGEGLDLEAMLAHLGYPLHRVSDASTACAEPPVCVVIDARAEQTSGFERAARLRATPALEHTPLLLVGRAPFNEEDLLRGLALGRVDFLLEPLHPQAVRARVRTVLELRRKEDALREAVERAEGAARERARRLEALASDFAALKRAKEDQTFLAAVSETLACSLDAEATLTRVAQQCIPHLGDGCFLDLVEPEGGLRRLAVAHQDPAREDLAREVSRRYPVQLEAPHGPAAAIRTGKTWCEPFMDDALLTGFALDATHLELLRALGITSLLSVPLRSRDQVLGAMTFIHGRPDRHHDAQDRRVAEDLARRAALALDNARLYSEAQAAVRLRDEFLTVASHELRTPLTPLQLTLATLARELWRDGIASHDARARHHLEVARTQVRKLAALVGALLDVGRLNHGRLTLELAETDLGEVLRDVADWFASEVAKAGSHLKLEYAADTRGRWDRLRLEQIITNLLSNALRYGAGGDIHARVEDLGDQVRLTVRDEGIGISPKDQERIFGRFERAVSGRHYGGLGLGLFITRNLVEALGGRIEVESWPRKGSTFRVTLPRAGPRTEDDVSVAPAHPTEPVGAHTGGAGPSPG
ncbi:GAF domain-containing protein [Pyxidicoccus parkwayensis]|uniref:histidine kinase n=1 Tax=Pyxidicoccus parkwayensis TaxID=2813578 RepID=A0ABX7NUB5_9BACT|nr:ATP-binding protein [Pyxidicoccus parkwaysis]QSQ20974.1 GAF domain-containing protein [Pyxidicoccus parkwaysis]